VSDPKAISQLDVATVLSGGSIIPIVDSGTTKQASLLTLFASAPLLTVAGLVKLAGANETISSGALSVTKVVSFVTNASVSTVSIALPDGSEGMLKIIIATTATHPILITSANGNSWSSMSLSAGNCALLYFSNGKWHVLSKFVA